ncbi:hypothetical protein ABFU82_01160 [Nocardioides sp. WV_118_6]
MTRTRAVLQPAVTALACALLLTPLAACGSRSDLASDSTPPRPTPSSTSAGVDATDPVDAAVRDAYRRATGAGLPAWAPEVRVYIGGRPAGRITAAEASAGASWDGCPQGDQEYAGRSCPVGPAAPLAALLADGGVTTTTVGAPAVVGCDRPKRPRVPEAARSVSIVPDEDHQDCFAAFSWTLYLDSDDEIVATDLVLSSP